MRRLIFTIILLIAGLSVKAQLYSNGFENQYTWYPPWFNLTIVADSTAPEGTFVCVCDSTQEYGLGVNIEVGRLYPHKNIHVQYEFLFKTDRPDSRAEIIFNIYNDNNSGYWHPYPLAPHVSDTATWSHMILDLDFPFDYIGNGDIKTYIWNREHENLCFDDAKISITPWDMPSFLPNIEVDKVEPFLLTEYILGDDTIVDCQLFRETGNGYLSVENELLTTNLTLDSTQRSKHDIQLSTTFHQKAQLLRQALAIPFADSTLTIYRRNRSLDTTQFQTEYYLDREGFKIGEGGHTVISYHQTGISSTQFDVVHRIAYFNLDYWRDHPLIHYPLNDTLEDFFEDVSCRQVSKGMTWNHLVTLYVGNDVQNLPRIMPIPYGYESGIIFTEHADWTNIRTHRAVLFGSERITKVQEATGGFVHYGIPVTKSVFYNNPDQVTNAATSHGAFTEPHCTINTDQEFEELLQQLYDIEFDICLHTPEQYTTKKRNFKKALKYMKEHFNSTTWIDHGYNNKSEHNREDLVCDGLNPDSKCYAVKLWQKNGIKYLWNAYYEENRLTQWDFDCNLMQPYPGYGDALPNRQITQLGTFYTWCTPSTLDASTDDEWDFYYSNERLQRLVDNHDVHITHIYPAWVWPGRTFWTYDADSTIVALPGMNRAFERIAHLRDEHKMLPMTIKTYLDYYTGLLHVDYEIIDGEHIRLRNNGDEIRGFSLLCTAPVRFEDNRAYETHESEGGEYVWFDLKPNDEVVIQILNP